MNGWIKLHRQLIDNGWLKNSKLFTFWAYCLLKATHEPTKIYVGYKEVNLEAGQFIFGRRKAAKEIGLSEREIRTCLDSLSKAGNLTHKTTHHFSIISIVNWNTYQGSESKNDPQNDPRPTHDRPHTRTKEQKKKKDPSEISDEISSLSQKLDLARDDLFQRMIDAVSSTRKSRKVSQGVILSLLQKLQTFPQENIQAGIRIYLEKAYHTQGKGEKYLLGIIRNHRPGEETPSQEFKSTGSPLLDAYYRRQAEGKA